MGFCDDIKEIRHNCFLSQEAFAKEIGVSFATVNRWESGKTKPTYKAMKLIDDFCKEHRVPYLSQKPYAFLRRVEQNTLLSS